MDTDVEGMPLQRSRESRPSSPAESAAHKRSKVSTANNPSPPSDILAGGTPVMNGEGC